MRLNFYSPIGTAHIVAADLPTAGRFQSAVNRNEFLLSPIGTAHLGSYMRRAYGTQLDFLRTLGGLKPACGRQVRRYNITRAYGTL